MPSTVKHIIYINLSTRGWKTNNSKSTKFCPLAKTNFNSPTDIKRMPMQLSNIQEQLGNKESYLYEYLFKIQGEKKNTE